MSFTNFPNGITSFGVPIFGVGDLFPTGNVYWVKHSTDADYLQFLEDRQTTYTDGTTSVYNTIQAAVNAATDKRGDIIVVCTSDLGTEGKWKEQVVITKAALKIYAANPGWETQMRPGDATTKYAFTPVGGSASGGFAFFVAARSVEIAGFLFDGGGGYSGVYVGDLTNVTGATATYGSNKNAASAYIHDNVFRGGGEGIYGMVLDGCSANVKIENNIFEGQTINAIYIVPGGSRTVQRPIIRGNVFTGNSNGAYVIDTYNSNTTVGIQVLDNYFVDGVSVTATGPVRFQGTGVHTCSGNHSAMTNSFGTVAIGGATDWESGNYGGSAGSGSVVVTES